MYARIARFEGAEAGPMQEVVDSIRGEAGPPEGVPAVRFMLLQDRAAGTGLAISFFATEEDMRTGDAALNAMTPPVQGVGRRTSVEHYEVAIELPEAPQ